MPKASTPVKRARHHEPCDLGRDLHDAPPDRVVAREVGRVAHRHRDAGVALDVLHLEVRLHGVDDDVLAVVIAWCVVQSIAAPVMFGQTFLLIPPVMLITAGVVMPVTVMGVETWVLETAAPAALVKVPCSTGSAAVVTAKFDVDPPMVNAAVDVLL